MGRVRGTDPLPARKLRRSRALRRAGRPPRRPRPRARDLGQPPLLPRHPAVGLRRDHRQPRPRRARPRAACGGLAAHRHREAVRARPDVGDPPQPRGRQGLPRVAGLSDRPLPRQGDGPQHPGLPLRERDLRAHLASPLRRPRPDHRGGIDRRREARRVLRGGGRVARLPPEPPHAAALARRDGAAGDLRCRSAPRREGQGAPRDRAHEPRYRGRERRARPVRAGLGDRGPGRRVPERGAGRPRVRDRDVRGGPPFRRRLALGGSAVLPAGREAPAEAGDRDRDPVQAGAARAVQGLQRRSRGEPSRPADPARRGNPAAVRRQGPGPRRRRAGRQHGLHLRLRVQRGQPGRLRDADPRRAPGRCLALHASRRGGEGLGDRQPDHRRVGRRAGARVPELCRGELGPRRFRCAARAGRATVAAELREPVDGRPGGAVAPPAIAVVPGDPELRWSSQATTIAGIEHELATFWALPQVNAVVGAPSDRVIAARTSVLNLVVVARSPELGERAASTLSMLTGRHPSRTLILVPTDPDGPDWLRAQVKAYCMVPRAGAPETFAEQIYATAGGATGRHLGAIVAPLLVHDLPVTLWWPGAPDLIGMADRLVVAGPARAVDGLDRLRALAALGGGSLAISDFALMRQSRWREAVASVFDRPEFLPYLRSLRRVAVTYGTHGGPDAESRTNIVKPIYHVAWLASRLGLRVVRPLERTARPAVGPVR